MGIRLDWDVESDSGHDAIEESAAAVAHQKQRQRLRTGVLISIGIVLGVVIGIAAWRYKIVRDEKERTLINTVEAEALAIRLGDQDKFMKFQGPAEEWRDEQRLHFKEMQTFNISVSGKILDFKMTPDEARVRVELFINGEADEAVWLYEYFPDKGWRHVSTEQTVWVQETRRSGPITYTYFTPDAPLASEMEATLSDWWKTAMIVTGVSEPLEVEIALARGVTQVRWESRATEKLLVPPEALSDPELRDELARYLGEQWMRHAMGLKTVNSNPYNRWVNEQAGLALAAEFGHSGEERSIFVPLADLYGDDFLAAFMRDMRMQEVPNATDTLQRMMEQRAPQQADADYFEHYLQIVVERNGTQERFYATSPIPELFVEQGTGEMPDPSMYGQARVGSVQVTELEPFQDVMWVHFNYEMNQGLLEDGMPEWSSVTAMMPFRKADGIWKIAQLTEDDWGAQITEESEHITLIYPELDASYYAGMAPEIEAVYMQAAEDFGLEDPPHIVVGVQGFRDEPGTFDVQLFSPHMNQCCQYLDNVQQYVEFIAVASVYLNVYFQEIGEATSPEFGGGLLEIALISARLSQLGYPAVWFFGTSVPMEGVTPPDTLEGIWTDQDGSGDSMTEIALDYLASQVLVEILLERHGNDEYLPMLMTLRTSGSIEEWLDRSLGISTGEIEAEWLAQYHIAIREQYGDAALP